ncbi:MAG: hypothetical protein D6776_04125 [Planctomycetota bacterium]|nr:MAG: hypothetical protein D6776_04125 [Planctomycetota bacterium]
MFQRFGVGARSAIERAWALATRAGAAYVEPAHLLEALSAAADSSFCGLLERFAVPPAEIRQAVSANTRGEVRTAAGGTIFSRATRRVFEYAVEEADRLGDREIGTRHFLLALLREGERAGGAPGVLLREGLDFERVRRGLTHEREGAGEPAVDRAFAAYLEALERRVQRIEAEGQQRLERLERRCERLEALLRAVLDGRGGPDES